MEIVKNQHIDIVYIRCWRKAAAGQKNDKDISYMIQDGRMGFCPEEGFVDSVEARFLRVFGATYWVTQYFTLVTLGIRSC